MIDSDDQADGFQAGAQTDPIEEITVEDKRADDQMVQVVSVADTDDTDVGLEEGCHTSIDTLTTPSSPREHRRRCDHRGFQCGHVVQLRLDDDTFVMTASRTITMDEGEKAAHHGPDFGGHARRL